MSYQVLARKYRPQSFADVIGQEHVTRTLQNAIAQQRIAHGYIFSGHRGIGKTTVARILAMALNCRAGEKPRAEPCGKCESCTEIRAGNSVDVIEIDAATNRGIDEIRELRDAARYRPARDRYKIYILDEAHQITDAAFNALLKTLEEPPPHIIFMMATTAPEDIPQTIRSRCQHFSFHAVRFDEIVKQLRAIATQEKIQADDDALALLAEAGDGSMRDALSIMDQAIASSGQALSKGSVLQLVGAVPGEVLADLLRAVHADSSPQVLRLIDSLMAEGQSPVHFARQLIRFLRNAVVGKVAGADSPLIQTSADERSRISGIAELFSEEDLTRFLQIMLRAYNEISYRADQRFHLELALLKLVHAQRLIPLEQLLSGSDAVSSAKPHPISPGKPIRQSLHPGADEGPDRAAASSRHKEQLSPFELDRVRRRGEPEMASSPAAAVTLEATAVALSAEPIAASAPAAVLEENSAEFLTQLRRMVLDALETSGHRMLASTLDSGQWSLQQSELVIEVPAAPSLLEMAVTSDARRIILSTASAGAQRALKLQIHGAAGGNGKNAAPPTPASNANSGVAVSARQRAANDPMVQRLQEKFSAEIRTVIDYREKKN